MGNALTEADITASLEAYKKAGLGGLEITPIYGVKGTEGQFVPLLSPRWVQLLTYTQQEARRLGLGLDLANASGWPFGGPWVQPEDACKNLIFKTFSVKKGQRLSDKIRYEQPPLVRAVGHTVKIDEVKRPLSANTNLQQLALDQIRFSLLYTSPSPRD